VLESAKDRGPCRWFRIVFIIDSWLSFKNRYLWKSI